MIVERVHANCCSLGLRFVMLLAEHIYPQDSDRDSNTIEVFVGRLRKKLPPELIETVRGLGYRMAAPS